MPTLTLKFKDQVLGEFVVAKGKTLTIGRREGNDVIIDNLAVSGSHAKVDSLEEGFLLIDLKSKNGTFVNEKMINTHWLKNGDVITIGKHTLALGLAPGETLPQTEEPLDKTMVLDTDEYRAMLDKSAPQQAAPAPSKEKIVVLSFLKGGQGEVELKKKLIKIGKDSSNDVVVDGFLVGKTAATISIQPAGFYLNYVQGMSKPKVNGKTVSESIKLKEFDIIEIGSAQMEFILKA
jgi:pSer/pThr/pTyr-binding forkhead associated (FHA) protein